MFRTRKGVRRLMYPTATMDMYPLSCSLGVVNTGPQWDCRTLWTIEHDVQPYYLGIVGKEVIPAREAPRESI